MSFQKLITFVALVVLASNSALAVPMPRGIDGIDGLIGGVGSTVAGVAGAVSGGLGNLGSTGGKTI
jgi:hypothetical protein